MKLRKKRDISTSQLLQKTETRVGLAVLGILVIGLVFVGARGVGQAARQLAARSNRDESAVTKLLSPVPSEVATSVQPSATPAAQAKVDANNQKLQAVTKLSYTSSAIAVRVREGDNFWLIAKRVCGSGKLANYLQRQTGYTRRVLQPGTVLSVTCD